MIKRWAMVNRETNIVENICNWDGTDRWSPPQGFYMIQTDIASIGDLYDLVTKAFTKNE